MPPPPNPREDAIRFLDRLFHSTRVRADTLTAVLALEGAGFGTFVLRVPRAAGQPVDGSLLVGGLAMRMVDERDLGRG